MRDIPYLHEVIGLCFDCLELMTFALAAHALVYMGPYTMYAWLLVVDAC